MTPIAQAVEPLRQAAVNCAAQYAEDFVTSIYEKLDACDWDIKAAYPMPRGTMDRAAYKQAMMMHTLARRLTTTDTVKHPFGCLRHGDPHYVMPHAEAKAQYVAEARKDASLQYDAFIAKLEQKVGAHTEATLTGDHVWGYSFLTVTTASGTQRWKTQQIMNVSKLGTVFNQWPTRLVK